MSWGLFNVFLLVCLLARQGQAQLGHTVRLRAAQGQGSTLFFGKRGEPAQDRVFGLSPDVRLVREWRGGRAWYGVEFRGRLGSLYPGGVGAVEVSQDRRHLAYVARKDPAGGFTVVFDGREGKTYPEVAALALSPDGRRVAYAARLAAGRWSAVMDGVEERPYDRVGALAFSRDALHFGYVAFKLGTQFRVRDGVEADCRDRAFARLGGFDSPGRAWVR